MKNANGERADDHARPDQVQRVERTLPFQVQTEHQLLVRLRIVREAFALHLCRCRNDLVLGATLERAQIDTVL